MGPDGIKDRKGWDLTELKLKIGWSTGNPRRKVPIEVRTEEGHSALDDLGSSRVLDATTTDEPT